MRSARATRSKKHAARAATAAVVWQSRDNLRQLRLRVVDAEQQDALSELDKMPQINRKLLLKLKSCESGVAAKMRCR
jgi:hypothetical protein